MPSLGEIIDLLRTAQGIIERLNEIWDEIREYAGEIEDVKKRKAFLDACQRRDAAAVRELLFD